jgi:outer membrane receptor protein involved in Fe transport
VFDLLNYTGNTDVNSASIGYTAAISWGDPEETELTLGNDLRVVTQALNEFGSGRIGANIFQNANSPIPKSQSIDPGIFLAAQSQVRERLKIRAGLRADWIHTEVLENPANLQTLGNYTNIFPIAVFNSQPTFAEIVGTENWNQSFSLVSGYLSAEHTLNEEWTMLSGAGVGRRPPSLTELYAAQPFMFLLQNGLNTVTGDPLLQDETFTQLDIGLQYQSEKWNGGVNAFHTWANNYITFENLSTDANQVNLKYVNTDLATFAGCEGFMQYQATEFMTPFMTISYVDGRDRTRNGNFATRQVNPQALVVSSFRDPTQVRGAFSGIAGGSEEALPGITPFESRLGLRFQTPQETGQLGAEISARIVASQTRVATSLLEQTTSGFTLWDMRLYYRPRPKALFYGGIENLTDITYREHLDFRNRNNITGIFQPGANFSFGAQLDF